MKSLREQLDFFKQFTKNVRDVGALFPGSKALARQMAHAINPGAVALRVLEVGAGPGNITLEILARLRPQDTLCISELNPEFCRILREKFVAHSLPGSPKVEVIEGPLQAFQPDLGFDHIVSSLPLNAFTPELIQDLWHHLRSLVRPGGVLTFYEYYGVRALRFLWPGIKERRRLAQVAVLHRRMTDLRFRRPPS